MVHAPNNHTRKHPTGPVPSEFGEPGVKASPHSTAQRRVPEQIPVLGSQPAGVASHTPGDRLPLLSARPAITLTALKRAAASFAVW